MEKLVLDWAKEKGILESGTPNGQLSKLQEEFFELSDAIFEKNVDEIIDGIGDMTVVLIILADMFGLSHTECLAYAYNQIKGRKGKMENGTFVKDAQKLVRKKSRMVEAPQMEKEMPKQTRKTER